MLPPSQQYTPYAVQYQHLPLNYAPHQASQVSPTLSPSSPPPSTHVSSVPNSSQSVNMCSDSSNTSPMSCEKMSTDADHELSEKIKILTQNNESLRLTLLKQGLSTPNQ